MARGSESLPNEAIFDIADATRAGLHLLIQLYGPSQCGKTLTGLYLARGLAGPGGTIGVMDTEGRARMFYDKIPGGFKVGELTRPFSPGRYLQGIDLFMRHGVDVLMIDSFSHCWEGIGGVLDQADQNEIAGRKGLAKWNKPKRDYNRMVSSLLTTRIPLIFCSRAKQPIRIDQVKRNGREVEEWVRLPWEPIQDSRLKYDMTIVVPMTLDGYYETDLGRLKCPDDLRRLFAGDQLTIGTGESIRKWIAGGEPVNHAQELLRKQAFDAASKGDAALREFYQALSDDQRLMLRPAIGNLKSAAAAADEGAEQQQEARDEAGSAADVDVDTMAYPFGYSDLSGVSPAAVLRADSDHDLADAALADTQHPGTVLSDPLTRKEDHGEVREPAQPQSQGGPIFTEIVPRKVKGIFDWTAYADEILAAFRAVPPDHRAAFRASQAQYQRLLRTANRAASTDLNMAMAEIEEATPK